MAGTDIYQGWGEYFVVFVSVAVVVSFSLGGVVEANSPQATQQSFEDLGNNFESTDDEEEYVSVIVLYEGFEARSPEPIHEVDGEVTGGEDISLLPILFARVHPDAIPYLEESSRIEAVVRDPVVDMSEYLTSSNPEQKNFAKISRKSSQSVHWGLNAMGAREVEKKIPDKYESKVDVAVLDTGIDYDHPDLDDNVVWGVEITNSVNYGKRYADDRNYHGTYVAGLLGAEDNSFGVVGVAPNADLYSVKILHKSKKYRGFTQMMITGLDKGIKGPDRKLGTQDDADVVSISQGAHPSLLTKKNARLLEAAVKRASKHSVIVAGAGNDGDGKASTDDVSYPARISEAIAVGGVAQNYTTVKLSSEGSAVDIGAPANDLNSTLPGWTGQRYAGGSDAGTSWAAPQVSGGAALVIARDLSDGRRDLSNSDVKKILSDSAVDIDKHGEDKFSGYGFVKLDAALNLPNKNPSPNLGLTPKKVKVGETVYFDASASSDSDGEIVKYEWSFGDGDRDVEMLPFGPYHIPSQYHHYEKPGTYTVNLKITDDDGDTTTVTKNVEVKPISPKKTTVFVRIDGAPNGIKEYSVSLAKSSSSVSGVQSGYVPPGNLFDTDYPGSNEVILESFPYTAFGTKDTFHDTRTLAIVTYNGHVRDKPLSVPLSKTVNKLENEKGNSMSPKRINLYYGDDLFRIPLPRSGAFKPPLDPDRDGKYEDVNGDGTLDYGDVASLKLAVANGGISRLSRIHKKALDFNGDGVVDKDDVRALSSIIP